MDLVSRNAEIAEIEHLLQRAAVGIGGLLVFSGARGSGKTALADAAVEAGRRRDFMVMRASPAAGQPGRLMWSQLLLDVGAPEEVATRLLEDGRPLNLDGAARALASRMPRLVVVDDIDRGGDEAVEVLSVLASRLSSTSTVLAATATRTLGIGAELALGPLSDNELLAMIGETRADVGLALGLASHGLPGLARSLAVELSTAGDGVDPVVHLALRATSTAPFLAVDVGLVRLLEMALPRATDEGERARLLVRLAHELLGDASAGAHRRALVDEALELARHTGDGATLAEVLDARLHALWDPAAAFDRLAAASEIIDLARAAGDGARERHGLFWRFVALIELGRVGEAESVLAAFEWASAAAGDAAGLVMVTARHAMLAIMRGRFEEATRLVHNVADMGGRARVSDIDLVVRTLRGMLMRDLGPPDEAAPNVELLLSFARHQPGHYYEATAAAVLATFGRRSEAGTELQRILPRALGGSGPRWLGAMASLAFVAAATKDASAASQLYEALLPYDGHLVVSGGAVVIMPPASHFLGLLAGVLGNPHVAAGHFQDAITLDEEIGALPYLADSLVGLADALASRGAAGDHREADEARRRARSIAERLGMTVLLGRLAPPADEWTLARDGDDWVLEAADERARLRDSRGLHYLRSLLAAPASEVSALDMVAGGPGMSPSMTGPVVDGAARDAYRRRLAALGAQLDAADRVGDAQEAQRVEAEREALVVELRRATGLGGRSRVSSPEAERARVNVTRTLRATLDRIALAAPRTGAYLQASIRTGAACRYEPNPGGPARWRV